MRKLLSIVFVLMLVVGGFSINFATQPTQAQSGSTYIFATFDGDGASEQELWIYTSSDGLNWNLLADTNYQGPTGTLRDPSIIKYNGIYYIAYTNQHWGTTSTSFNIASSSDLINWSHVTTVDAGVSGTGRTWAPEFFVEGDTVHVIVSLSPPPSPYVFREYYYTAQNANLTSWSGPTLMNGIGPNIIDTFVVKVGNTYHAFTQNGDTLYIEHATATSLSGPWTYIATGDWAGWGSGKEGPALFQLDDGTWTLFADWYSTNGIYRATSSDLTNWSSPLTSVSSLSTKRHGTVLRDTSSTPTPTPPPVSQDPVVWYAFDESSGTTASDSSGNGQNATLVNGPTWASGQIGNAVNLDGSNDYVSMPTGVVSGLNDFSIAAWVNLDSISNWSRLFDFGTGETANMFLTPQNGGTGAVRFAITTGSYSAEQQITGSSALPTGQWVHVAVTKSGNTGTLYVNGSVVGTNTGMTLSPSSLGNTNQNYIGQSQYADPYLDGRVDDFRIYNRALSSSEVSDLASGGGPTPTPTNTPVGPTNTPTSTPTVTNTPVGPTPTPTAQPGGLIPQTNWTLQYVDSEETSGEDGAATNAFDGNTGTIWHTEWESSTPTHPHEIQINLGASYNVDGFRYLPRQDGNENGRISQYEFYVSADGGNWGSAVATGTFANSSAEKEVTFAAKTGQYVRLVALSEVNGNAWTSAAEINVLGTSSGGPTATPTNTPVGPTNTPTPTNTPASSSTYQAEDANVGGGATIDSNHTGYNGSGFVNFPSSGGYVEYQNVDGGSGGSRTLQFRFALGASSARTGSLIINGSSQNITFQPTGAWNSWNTMNLAVNLNSGTGNTIRLESTGQDLANQDQLIVSESAPTPTPTPSAINNPVLPGLYADPHVDVFGSTYYIYPTTDGIASWGSTSFKTFSSSDLINWTDEGVILDLVDDISWCDQYAWAPAISFRNGTYYYYFSACQQIGVATSTSPTGPFQDALGQPLVTTGQYGGQSIDPMVFIDDDGQAYMYFGQGELNAVMLNSNMVSFNGTPTNIEPPGYNEGAFVFKRNGTYYFMWSENDTRSEDYRVAYGTASSPLGPISKVGTILQKDTSQGILGTGHHSVLKIPSRDEYYMVYHRHGIPNGDGTHREVNIDRMYFSGNTIQMVQPTLEGLQSPVYP